MEYLFSRFTDENNIQGDQVSSSEVIEPMGDGLEFELLIDRAGCYSKPYTLSIASDFQSPRGCLQQEGQGSLRTKILGQSTEANCWLNDSREVTETGKSLIHEGEIHDLCWNYTSVVYQRAIYTSVGAFS